MISNVVFNVNNRNEDKDIKQKEIEEISYKQKFTNQLNTWMEFSHIKLLIATKYDDDARVQSPQIR